MFRLVVGNTMATAERITSLRGFILNEMKQRQMSATKFAEHVGVVASTITRATDSTREPPMPTLDFLAKLAKSTGVDICALVALVLPGVSTAEDPEDRLLTAQIRRLRESDQAIIESFITNATLQNRDQVP